MALAATPAACGGSNGTSGADDPGGKDATSAAAANDAASGVDAGSADATQVDLTQAPGTDSSHPAFYLPGQELLAGNGRGVWALDP